MNLLHINKKIDALKKAINPFIVIFWIFASVIVALVFLVLRRKKSSR
jgi:hypothetical protein